MRELTTYILEGFYQNIGTKDDIALAKLSGMFDGDYKLWIKNKIGLPTNSYSVKVFLTYICKCFDYKLGSSLIVNYDHNKQPIYINSRQDLYSLANISATQSVNVQEIDRFNKWSICPFTHLGQDCTNDITKILRAVDIDYEIINISASGHSKKGNRIIVKNIKEYLK